MVTTQEQRWNRSKYPLQLSSKGPTGRSSEISQSLPENASGRPLVNDDPAAWHRAVTMDRPKRYSITSQAGSDSNLSSPRLADDHFTTQTSSTAFSMSRSASPPSVRIHQKLDNESPTPKFVQPSTRSTIESSQDMDSRNLTSNPAENTIKSSTPTQSDVSDQGEESDHSAVPSSPREDGSSVKRTRTLRRIPRSLRIESTKLPVDVRPKSAASIDEHSDVPSAGGKPWRRKVYPLLSVAGDMSPTHEGPTSIDTSQELSNGAIDDTITQNEHSSQTPPRSLLNPVASKSSGPPTSEAAPNQVLHPPSAAAIHQPEAETQSVKSNKSLRRKAYPLQTPASTANLRQSPTPPASPTPEQTPSNLERSHEPEVGAKTPANTKSLRRHAYPLQAPASTTNLRQSPTPPQSPRIAPDATKDGLNDSGKKQEYSGQNKPLRRRGYPLQTPASNTNLRESPAPPRSSYVSPQVASAEAVGQHQRSNSKVSQPNQPRRRVYPLQSPASTSNLQQPDALTQPMETAPVKLDAVSEEYADKPRDIVESSASLYRRGYPLQQAARAKAEHPSQQLSQKSISSLEKSSQIAVVNEKPQPHQEAGSAPQDSASFSRKGYPLQSTSTVPDVHFSPPTPPAEDHAPPAYEDRSAKQSRDRETTAKIVNHWQHLTYPHQSPRNLAPFARSPSPLPPGADSEETKPESYHLPKNMRAVKDADSDKSEGRTIVVCLDGTGDKFDNDNSNIVHLISALKKDDPRQVTYYQAGIGTYGQGGLSSGFEAALDMAVGSGLGLHIRDAYHFLMHTYKEGDKICIIGFSRGAYTARCLAGMIHKVGLLPPRNIQQIPFAYEFYANDTADGWKQSDDFKRTFCIDVCVYFLGCFDSVASVGFIPRQLPLSSTPNSKPRYFRHAMALDERRAKFKVCRHQKKKLEEIQKPDTSNDSYVQYAASKFLSLLPSYKEDQADAPSTYSPHAPYGKSNHPNVTDEEYDRLEHHEEEFDTDVLEVWFAGAHADVGGGAVPNDERHKLAQIPLRWMIRQAFLCNTGIIFKTKVLAEYGLDVHTLWPKYRSLSAPSHGPPPSFLEKYDKTLPPRANRRAKLIRIDKQEKGEDFYQLKGHNSEDWTPEQAEDFYDAMTRINDQLIDAPNWWILEFLPVQYKVPISPGHVQLRTGMNMGRYRGVDDVEPNVHWTVLHRARQMGYKIQARTAEHTTWRTVV